MTANTLNEPKNFLEFVNKLPNPEEVVYRYDAENSWVASNEWLCGTFCGGAFYGDTKEQAVQHLIEYLDRQLEYQRNFMQGSMVGRILVKSGWPDAQKVLEYVNATRNKEADNA